MTTTPKALDGRARRAAKRAGMFACKARISVGIDNRGGYRLVDAFHNRVVAGEKFNLSAQDVLDYCAG